MFSFFFLMFANFFGVHLGGWFAHTALFCLLGNRQKKTNRQKMTLGKRQETEMTHLPVAMFIRFCSFSSFFSEIYMMFGTLFPKKSEKVAEGIFVSFFIHISLPFCFVFVYILHSYLFTFGFVFVQLWCL